MRLFPSVYIGPMSANIAFALRHIAIWFPVGTCASRRQIEYDGGYVNNWTTEEFAKYMREVGKVTLVRDHAGPGQGAEKDDGFESLAEDIKHMDIIHIDPWKEAANFESGLRMTEDYIDFCYRLNPNILFEVGTEQAIFEMTPEQLEALLGHLKSRLPGPAFKNIVFAVIQSGTALKGNTNIGEYDPDKLVKMVKSVKKYPKILTKEHNGDYLPRDLIKEKMKLGLNAINIAPEFGKLETDCILNRIEVKNRPDIFDKFFEICLESCKWKKWVDKDYNPFNDKEGLIKICGHYVFSNPKFIELKRKLGPELDEDIQIVVRSRIMELCQ